MVLGISTVMLRELEVTIVLLTLRLIVRHIRHSGFSDHNECGQKQVNLCGLETTRK